MGKILVLPKEVVSKIAAGEVVQRPANVVKELVENSLDANSTEIKVKVIDGGSTYIEVIDNGEGMLPEDVEKSVLQHSTSKLSTAADLDTIQSLGFRGEALCSIASVSKLSIKSRTSESVEGYCVVVDGGEVVNSEACGMPKGTIVTVEDLFFNTPARKKFTKTAQTEFSHIAHIISNIALANPEVGFELTHNDKEILNIRPNDNFKERLELLLGETLTSNFVPVKYTEPHFEIFGYVSKPQYASKGASRRYLFVNKRFVSSGLLSSVVKKSYGNLLEPGTGPAFVLHISFSPDFVDVNVDPKKETVRFVNENFVNNSVERAVKEALQKSDLTYINQGYIETNKYLLSDDVLPSYFSEAMEENPCGGGKVLQIHNLYLLKETEKGLLLVDQHAAHERILYEKFLNAYKTQRNLEPSDLANAVTFDLPLADAAILKENLDVFNQLGFEIEEFGKNVFKVTGVPKIISDRNVVALIEEVLDDINSSEVPQVVDTRSKRALSYLACRSAIKAGDYLTPIKREKLLNELEETNSNYTCPHGRPVKVEISTKDIGKLFKR